MDQLDQERAALLRTLKARERRLYFDWIAEHFFAIADYTKLRAPPVPIVLEPIRLTILVGPTITT